MIWGPKHENVKHAAFYHRGVAWYAAAVDHQTRCGLRWPTITSDDINRDDNINNWIDDIPVPDNFTGGGVIARW